MLRTDLPQRRSCRVLRACRLADHPAVDLGDHPVLLGDREEAGRGNDLAVAADEAQQQLLAWAAAIERDDGLGVDGEPPFVYGVTDTSDPTERGEFALDAGLLIFLLGDVAECDNNAGVGGTAAQRGGGVCHGNDGSVLTCEGLVDDSDTSVAGTDAQ